MYITSALKTCGYIRWAIGKVNKSVVNKEIQLESESKASKLTRITTEAVWLVYMSKAYRKS